MNVLKNIMFMLCIINAIIFAIINPMTSLAFTAIAFLLGITSWTDPK